MDVKVIQTAAAPPRAARDAEPADSMDAAAAAAFPDALRLAREPANGDAQATTSTPRAPRAGSGAGPSPAARDPRPAAGTIRTGSVPGDAQAPAGPRSPSGAPGPVPAPTALLTATPRDLSTDTAPEAPQPAGTSTEPRPVAPPSVARHATATRPVTGDAPLPATDSGEPSEGAPATTTRAEEEPSRPESRRSGARSAESPSPHSSRAPSGARFATPSPTAPSPTPPSPTPATPATDTAPAEARGESARPEGDILAEDLRSPTRPGEPRTSSPPDPRAAAAKTEPSASPDSAPVAGAPAAPEFPAATSRIGERLPSLVTIDPAASIELPPQPAEATPTDTNEPDPAPARSADARAESAPAPPAADPTPPGADAALRAAKVVDASTPAAPASVPPSAPRTLEAALRVMPGFERQLAARAREFLERGQTEIRIALDPPSLGRLKVRLLVTETEAIARISASSPEAAARLERDRAELQKAFEEQGFARVDVRVEADGHRSHDFEEDAPRGEARAAEVTPTERRTASRRGRVDLFV